MNNKGFILPLAIAVLSLAFAVFLIARPNNIQQSNQKWTSETQLEIDTIGKALDKYWNDTNKLPSNNTKDQLLSLIYNSQNLPGWNGPYIDSNSNKITKDEFRHNFIYKCDLSNCTKVVIISKGKDGTLNSQYNNFDFNNGFPWQAAGDDIIFTKSF